MSGTSPDEQREVCLRYGASFEASPEDSKLGIAQNVRSGLRPVNGLRHPATETTNGWYIWAGETLSDDPSFFVPLHVEHLDEWCPGIRKFLGLGPGWRFLTDLDGYEDVWYDASILDA